MMGLPELLKNVWEYLYLFLYNART